MKKTVIIAIVISSVVALLMNFAIELTAGDIKPWFEGREWLVYLILGLTFIATLALTIFLLREQNQGASSDPETRADIEIEDTVSSGGKIEKSPIQVHRDSKTTIKRSASDKGKIDSSDITIE